MPSKGRKKQGRAKVAQSHSKAGQPKVPFHQRPGVKLLTKLGEVGLRLADKAYLGGAAGKMFDTLTGHGDYTLSAGDLPYDVKANTVIHPKMTPTVPMFSDDRGATRVRHREYLTNVQVTQAFSNSPFRLQPGDAKTFPWLSAIANLYQQYKFLGCVFEYVTTSGVFSAPSPALGQVMMVTNYNVTEPLFTNQANMLNSYFSCSGVPSTSLMHAVECENAEQPYQLYLIRDPKKVPTPIVDPGGVSYNGRDTHLYDFGMFQFASVGGPVAAAGFVAGQLWITYDIMLYKPKLPDIGFGTEPPALIADSVRAEFGMPTQEEADAKYLEAVASLRRDLEEARHKPVSDPEAKGYCRPS